MHRKYFYTVQPKNAPIHFCNNYVKASSVNFNNFCQADILINLTKIATQLTTSADGVLTLPWHLYQLYAKQYQNKTQKYRMQFCTVYSYLQFNWSWLVITNCTNFFLFVHLFSVIVQRIK